MVGPTRPLPDHLFNRRFDCTDHRHGRSSSRRCVPSRSPRLIDPANQLGYSVRFAQSARYSSGIPHFLRQARAIAVWRGPQPRPRLDSSLVRRPDREDLRILLRIMEIYLSDPMRKARSFWRTIPDGLTLEELLERYPRGSEEFELFGSMMVFWETIGSLIKHGLLNEELAFDTFLDAPPWKK